MQCNRVYTTRNEDDRGFYTCALPDGHDGEHSEERPWRIDKQIVNEKEVGNIVADAAEGYIIAVAYKIGDSYSSAEAYAAQIVSEHNNHATLLRQKRELISNLRAAISYLEDDSRSERRRQACLASFRATLNAAVGEGGD